MANHQFTNNHIFITDPSPSVHRHQSTPPNTNSGSSSLTKPSLPAGSSPTRLFLSTDEHTTPHQKNNSFPETTQATTPHPKTGYFVYPENLIQDGVQACARSILGKFITDKPIHINSIQTGLSNIWGNPAGLQIQEIEGKIIQFFIDNKLDHDRILLGNPWIFRNSWLVIKPWDRETNIRNLDFDHVPVWIQLWGLPNHCKTKQMGESLGALLGRVEAVEFYEYPGKNRILKIKVAINIHNPIQTGIHVGNPTDGTTWIDFRYEKLPQICYSCGLVGHADNLCQNLPLEQGNSTPLGPWIRSTQYGRRVMEAKDKRYYSNPSQSKDFGHYSPPVPDSLLQELASLKLQQTSPMATTHNKQQTMSPTTKNYLIQPRNIQGPALELTMMESTPKGNYSTSSKRQRTEEPDSPQNELAGSAKQASQQL